MSISEIIIIVYYLAASILGLIILLENRNPPKTLAYLLTLVTLPVLGIVVYYFVGRNFRKRKLFSRKAISDLRTFIVWELTQLTNFRVVRDRAMQFLKSKYKVAELLIRSDRSVLSACNQVEILINGNATVDQILKDLENASHHIHLEYYIYESDEVGRSIGEVLKRKAKEGVEVRFCYDDVGSRAISKSFLKDLKSAGVEVYPILPVIFPWLSNKTNYRDHRKIIIVDGKIGFLGGINISSRYLNTPTEFKWRDTHLRIEGEAVRSLQANFLTMWNFVSGQSVLSDQVYFPNIEADSGQLVQIVSCGPDSDWATIMHAFFMSIVTAEKYIYIQTPYYIPNDQIQTALITAAQSGVDVQLMLPRKSDSKFVQAASMSYLKPLLEAGVKIHMYKPGFLHAKTMVVDDLLSSVGTANMDHRSFDINFEINAFIYDEGLAGEMKDIFLKDKLACELLTPRRWEKRRIRKRIFESFARVFAPLL